MLNTRTNEYCKQMATERTRSIRVSVIIPAHNAASTVMNQLRAVAPQVSDINGELICVLNRCTDETRHVIAGHSLPLDIQVIEANAHASAGYARNVGFSISTGELIAFCDADDYADEEWLKELISPFNEPKVEIVAGRLKVDRAGLPTTLYEWRYRHLDERILQSSSGGDYALTASIAVRRRVFVELNGFREDFPGAAGEDVDFFIRARRQGVCVAEAPKSIMNYVPRDSFFGVAQQAAQYMVGSLFLEAVAGAPVAQQKTMLLRKALVRAFNLLKRPFRALSWLQLTEVFLFLYAMHCFRLLTNDDRRPL